MTAGPFRVRIGPVLYELRSPIRRVMREVRALYRDYPGADDDGIVDYAVGALPVSPLRRFVRPSLHYVADFNIAEIVPMEARLGALGFEMVMNLQIATGYLRHVVLHAACAAKAGEAVVMIGDSGSGKSTLSALLSYAADGWRHFGDEFTLLSLDRPEVVPFPRPISLKNKSIAVMEAAAPAERFGPVFEKTFKGTLRHLLPPRAAIDVMAEPARPALIVAPRFVPGARAMFRPMSRTETFVRLSAASTNHARQGEAGFDAFLRLLGHVRAFDITYGSSEDALKLLDGLWTEFRR